MDWRKGSCSVVPGGGFSVIDLGRVLTMMATALGVILQNGLGFS